MNQFSVKTINALEQKKNYRNANYTYCITSEEDRVI